MEKKKGVEFSIGIFHGKGQLEGPRGRREDKLILKLIPEKYFIGIWTAFNWLKRGLNGELWWLGNELSGSIKARLS
jgi:hypothetical protein